MSISNRDTLVLAEPSAEVGKVVQATRIEFCYHDCGGIEIHWGPILERPDWHLRRWRVAITFESDAGGLVVAVQDWLGAGEGTRPKEETAAVIGLDGKVNLFCSDPQMIVQSGMRDKKRAP